jgi:hypothetical protein
LPAPHSHQQFEAFALRIGIAHFVSENAGLLGTLAPMLWIIDGEPWPCEKSTLARGLYGSRQSPARYATCEMKALDYGVVELAALSALSALGCVIAAGHLLFVALFGAASTVAIIETMRRLR